MMGKLAEGIPVDGMALLPVLRPGDLVLLTDRLPASGAPPLVRSGEGAPAPPDLIKTAVSSWRPRGRWPPSAGDARRH